MNRFVSKYFSYYIKGILPAATNEIKIDLNINDALFGWLGSSAFIGKVI